MTITVHDGESIQTAINNAAEGETIIVEAGTYGENLTIDHGVIIEGANSGIAGAGVRGTESVITGTVVINSATAVHIDGVEFADQTAWATGPAAAADLRTALTLSSTAATADHIIENSIFLRDPVNDDNTSNTFVGGANAQSHRGLLISGGNNGDLEISSNLFTGTNTTYNYDSDVWRSEIWSDGNAAGTTEISDNVFQHGRTAINADSFNSQTTISGNTFEHVGSGISVGVTVPNPVDNIENNDFTNVDTEFNFQNLTTSVHFDADATGNEATVASDPVLILGGSAADSLGGSDGNDIVAGGAGSDSIGGGSGSDTVVEVGNRSDFTITHGAAGHYTVQDNNTGDGNEGTDDLANVEAVQFNGGTTVTLNERVEVLHNGAIVNTFHNIQDAINAAANGDTINVGAGTYNENVTVNKEVTMIGAGDGDDVVIQGTFKSDNGIAPGGSVADFLKTAPSYITNSGTGVTITADNVTIENLKISGFNADMNLGASISHVHLEDVTFDGAVDGLRKASGAQVTDLDIIGGSFTDDYTGMYIAKDTASNLDLDDVLIDGTSFTHITAKGIYAESLSNALITNITMTNVAEFGRGPAFGPAAQVGGFGDGIDLNLKWDHELTTDTTENNAPFSNITIQNFTFTDVGSSDKDGAGSAQANGAAIAIKVRDDAPTYSSPEAGSFDGSVIIQNGTINGTSTGIKVGEPGKNISDPDVTVTNVSITNEVHNADHGDVANVSQSTLTVNLTNSADTQLASTSSTGPIALHGFAGNDTLGGGGGNDLLDGGTGADSMTGGDGNDTYVVDNSNDKTIEASTAGAGTADEVQVGINNYTLATNVENLTLLEGNVGTRIDFHDYSLGTIDDGEKGWKEASPGSPAQGVVNVGGAHGQVWQVANDPTSGDFGGPYSPELAATAGESGTTANFNTFTYSLQFKAVNTSVDGSRVEIDLGNEAGTDRNNYLVLEWTNGGEGLRLAVNEPLPNVSGDWTNNDFDFATGNRTLAASIDATAWHQIDLKTTFVAATNNDVIDVYLDGKLVGHTTTFENYRDFHLSQSHATAAEANQVDRLLFRTGEADGNPFAADGAGSNRQGFYIDNVNYGVGTAPVTATGNALSNVITGNSIGNALNGLGGNDTIDGAGGNDTLVGGAGADSLVGGVGTDTASYAASTLAVAVSLAAGIGLGGDANGDSLSGIENLIGSINNDILTGDGQDNVLTGGKGADQIDGGGGSDTVDYSGSVSKVTVNLGTGTAQGGDAAGDALSNIENLIGTNTTDKLTGSDADNRLEGGGAADTLTGGIGADTLLGGAGSGKDVLDGGTGIDSMVGGADDDTYYVNETLDVVVEQISGGTDLVHSTAATYTLTDNVEKLTLDGTGDIDGIGNTLVNVLTGNTGSNDLHAGDGNDTISGGNGNDNLYGEADNDKLLGQGGDDHLYGDEGNDILDGGTNTAGVGDTMEGGNGSDVYYVDSDADQVVEGALAGGDTVHSTINYTLGANVDYLILDGTGDIDGTGNGDNNKLTGNAGKNDLSGDAGADTISGLAQTDSINGDAGADNLSGGDGNDTVHGGTENDAVSGNNDADQLFGDAGNDVLVGGLGIDNLTGGTGADLFRYVATAESTSAARDVILDFNQAEGDRIDVKGIDADTVAAGDQAYTYIGNGAFTGLGTPQLGWHLDGGDTIVQADTNGNGTIDLEIVLQGFTSSLFTSDFIL